jgi:IMP cyclohydrolase
MNNPNGPYPGRQLFLGLTVGNKPCLAYLVTGRSPESRERKALLMGDLIRIGPLGNQQYDPLRHYAAVKFDNVSGIASVSNGIQTEAIFETYKLLYNTSAAAAREYLEKILDGAGAEPDSYHTPRIAGLVTSKSDRKAPVLIVGIKAFNQPARGTVFNAVPGTLTGISTYKGSLDSPEARDPAAALPQLSFNGNTAEDLANYLFDISAADYKGNDIRVCSVAGIRSENGSWILSIRNVH